MKKISSGSIVIYFLFATLYYIWVLLTYRNIIHMDMVNIVGTKVKDLCEHNLRIVDFIYEPLFPCTTSLIFTFLNVIFFHLNTIVETVVGTAFLIAAGYIYFSKINAFLISKRQKMFFALLIGFITFGFHKWEASFTSFFSFAVFFDLCICFFNYFFVVRYVGMDQYERRWYHLPILALSNLLVIVEAPAYFYAYNVSILILLMLIRWFEIIRIDKKRWNSVVTLYVFLLLLTVGITSYLSHNPDFSQYASKLSVGGFIGVFFQKPLWVIQFYLIANSGAYWGEAFNRIGLRTVFGAVILVAYGMAIYRVIRSKDKRLLVPVALIFYNIISCGFITMGRYYFASIEYGASSRYTAFNLSGALGLVTIIFFYILEEKRKSRRIISSLLLTGIILANINVDKRQLIISSARISSFKQMETSLLTGEDLDILQAPRTAALRAIEVLKKYNLNVYYENAAKMNGAPMDLARLKKVNLISGTAAFTELTKIGFYDNENGISWTNGKAAIFLNNPIEIADSLFVQLNTYMPPICEKVNPKLSIVDEDNKEYLPVNATRKGGEFYYYFYLNKRISLKRINLSGETVDASPDLRLLSFPFASLEMRVK